MKHLTDLIEYLEANHHYAQVDEMTKLALDMTDVLKEDNQLGKGLYGNFHSDFSNEDKRKLKNQLGNLPNNVGVKQYKINPYDKIAFEIDNISENLVFIYVAPYISQNTDLLTPVYNGTVSLSTMITNKINVTQKMPGVTLSDVMEDLIQMYPNAKDQRFEVRIPLENKILEKLKNIGVSWPDIHDKNYLLNRSTVREFLMWAAQNPEEVASGNFTFDLSTGAALFDFGMFEVKSSTPPGKQLEALRNKMASQNNKLMEYIVKAINEILI